MRLLLSRTSFEAVASGFGAAFRDGCGLRAVVAGEGSQWIVMTATPGLQMKIGKTTWCDAIGELLVPDIEARYGHHMNPCHAHGCNISVSESPLRHSFVAPLRKVGVHVANASLL